MAGGAVRRELNEIEYFNWCVGQPYNVVLAVHARGDLTPDTVDRRLLGRDLAAGGIHRDAIIAVVDPEDHVAGPHHGVVAWKDRRDVT